MGQLISLSGNFNPLPRQVLAHRRANWIKAGSSPAPKLLFGLQPNYGVEQMSIQGDRLFIMSFDGLRAVHSKTGELIWEKQFDLTKISARSSPSRKHMFFSGETIFYSMSNHQVTALDINTGQELWNFNSQSQIFWGPAAANGLIYFCGVRDKNELFALDARTGRQIWHRQIGSTYNLAVQGNLLTRTDDNILESMDALTGEEKWVTDLPLAIDHPRLRHTAESIYVFYRDLPGIFVFDALSGQSRYNFNSPTNIAHIFPQADTKSSFDFASDRIYLYALDPGSGSVVWKHPLPPSQGGFAGMLAGVRWQSFRVINGKVYFFCNTGRLQVVEENSGELLRDRETNALVTHSEYPSEAAAFVIFDNWLLSAVDLNTQQPLWSFASTQWEERFDQTFPLLVNNGVAHGILHDMIYGLEYPAPSEILDPTLPRPELSIPRKEMFQLSEQEYKALLEKGFVSTKFPSSDSAILLTLRREQNDNNETKIQVDVFTTETASRHIGMFCLCVNKDGMAEDNLLPVMAGFSREAKNAMMNLGFGPQIFDVRELNKALLFKIGATSYATLGNAQPMDEKHEIIEINPASSIDPSPKITMLAVPETSLWSAFPQLLDTLLIDTALKIAKGKFAAKGFKVEQTERFPLLCWSRFFGAVPTQHQSFFVPLSGSTEEIKALLEKKRQDALLDWD